VIAEEQLVGSRDAAEGGPDLPAEFHQAEARDESEEAARDHPFLQPG